MRGIGGEERAAYLGHGGRRRVARVEPLFVAEQIAALRAEQR